MQTTQTKMNKAMGGYSNKKPSRPLGMTKAKTTTPQPYNYNDNANSNKVSRMAFMGRKAKTKTSKRKIKIKQHGKSSWMGGTQSGNISGGRLSAKKPYSRKRQRLSSANKTKPKPAGGTMTKKNPWAFGRNNQVRGGQ